jgi:hypothetical protein
MSRILVTPKYVLLSSIYPMCAATPMISMIQKNEFLSNMKY